LREGKPGRRTGSEQFVGSRSIRKVRITEGADERTIDVQGSA
jgi:hypothetical protein